MKTLTPEEHHVAKTHHDALLAIGRRETMCKAEAAAHLRALKKDQLFVAFGSSSIEDYGTTHLGYSPGQTRDLLVLDERLERMPELAAIFRKGEAEWTKVRAAARGAEATGDETEWVSKVKTLSSYQLQQEAARASGEPLKRRVVLEFTEEQYADFEDAVNKLRRELGKGVSKAEAVLHLLRQGLASGEDGLQYLIAIGYCLACGTAERQTSAGRVIMSPEAFLRAACEARRVDLTGDRWEKLERTIPRKVRRYVKARDNDRCVFPGCPNRGFLELHHEGGWQIVEHDRTKIYTQCELHHTARHAGRIVAVLEGSLLQFVLPDGTAKGAPIELDVAQRKKNFEAKQRAKQQNETRSREQNETRSREQNETRSREQNETRSREQNETRSREQNETRSREQNETRSREQNESVTEALVHDAGLALRGLEFTATEAKRLVQAALSVPRVGPWTVDALVQEALRRSG